MVKFIDWLRNALYEPRVKDVSPDDPNLLAIHASVLKEKVLLRGSFRYFYKKMFDLSEKYLRLDGLEVELGSGAGFIKVENPSVLTSDIRNSGDFDLRLDAQQMDLSNGSVGCMYAINVFHHLPDPTSFFRELDRVLVHGGGCILIEPHAGWASAALHKRLHKDEYFDPHEKDWANNNICGPLSGANQALAHIIFDRDLARFEDEFGHSLEVVHRQYCTNGLRHLLSGGLNFRQLAPDFFHSVISGVEWLLTPFASFWSLHQIIVIRRR